MTGVNLRNVLILLGIIITAVGLVFFATEFVDLISDWGRVLDLVLLGIMFIAIGVHFDQTEEGTELLARPGWRWLSARNALFILGAFATLSAVIAFLAVQGIDRIWQLLALLVVGLGLIIFAARRFTPSK